MTVSPAKLAELSVSLYDAATRDGFRPEAVIGIATGGVHVVEAMSLPASVDVHTCRLSRPTTQAKESSGAQRVLKRLPVRLADWLRLLEDGWLERAPVKPAEPTPTLIEQTDAIGKQLSAHGTKRILIVDDAVDSGSTLKCVLDAVKARLPADAQVITGVLTVTRSANRRCITPDHFVLEQVLLRFPWSNDYKPSASTP